MVDKVVHHCQHQQQKQISIDVMLCIVWVPCDIRGGPGAVAILILALSSVYILTIEISGIVSFGA